MREVVVFDFVASGRHFTGSRGLRLRGECSSRPYTASRELSLGDDTGGGPTRTHPEPGR